MSAGVIRDEQAAKPQTVTIPRDQFGYFLDAVRSVRTGFLICAPRFAVGSRGEQMVAVASELGKTLDEFYEKLAAKPEKADKTDPAPAK